MTRPIFIVGVPRSGTTLLRVILDSHPSIACGPEAPWLYAYHGRTVQALHGYLADDPLGYCANFGGSRQEVAAAVRGLIEALLGGYAQRRGKRRWAEKTPNSAPHLGFVRELFPEAQFVHIVRDGMDVAASTSIVPEHRKDVSKQHNRRLDLGTTAGKPPLRLPNTPFAAAIRWNHWNRLIRESLEGTDVHTVTYERLVAEPEPTIGELCSFLGEPFDAAMLGYRDVDHDTPGWEWGTADLLHRDPFDTGSVGRGERELRPMDREIIAPMVGAPGPALAAVPPRLASAAELQGNRFRLFMDRLNALAGPLDLHTFTDWSKVWEYPRLWFNALSRVPWEGKRVVDIGSERSPMPWLMALLGAEVTMIEVNDKPGSLWNKLRDQLRVKIDWRIVEGPGIPLPDGSADVVTSFSVIEHQPDKRAAVDEAARVLKPGGLFALSADICEPEMGMSFPEWNGRAMTMREFTDLIWRHPAFGNDTDPQWNVGDIPEFLAWHRRSAPHHNYTAAAAAMVKRG